MTETRRRVLDDCLAVSKMALALFDAVESDDITYETAGQMILMARTVDQIARGIRTVLLTEDVPATLDATR